MRPLLFLAPLMLAVATPSVAQQAEDDIWADDPYAAQDETVLAVDRLLGALFDLPVGPLIEAMPEIAGDVDVRDDDTLRDLATRRDPDFEERTRGGARAMTAVAGTMLERFRVLLPELEAMGERLGEAMEE